MHKLNAVRKIGDATLRAFGLYGGRSGKSGQGQRVLQHAHAHDGDQRSAGYAHWPGKTAV